MPHQHAVSTQQQLTRYYRMRLSLCRAQAHWDACQATVLGTPAQICQHDTDLLQCSWHGLAHKTDRKSITCLCCSLEGAEQ